MKTITINVSESVYRDIQEYARSVDRSTSELIREAMQEYRDARVRPRSSVLELEPLDLGEVRSLIGPDDDLLGEMLDDVRA